jgi:hypothetical protein
MIVNLKNNKKWKIRVIFMFILDENQKVDNKTISETKL